MIGDADNIDNSNGIDNSSDRVDMDGNGTTASNSNSNDNNDDGKERDKKDMNDYPLDNMPGEGLYRIWKAKSSLISRMQRKGRDNQEEETFFPPLENKRDGKDDTGRQILKKVTGPLSYSWKYSRS